MSEEEPLYRRELLRLAADAIGAGSLPDPDATATAHNPACGDRVTVEIKLAEGRVSAFAHATQACILAQASASLLADRAPGRDIAGLTLLAVEVRTFLQGGPAPAGFEPFLGVASHSGRHVCVLLPFEAALKALEAAKPGAVGSKAHAGT
jgi:nitrogen fixation protein NifU and related proteins